MKSRFHGSFTQQANLPAAAEQAALSVLRSGRLHRYNTVAGETGEVGLLEQEFATYTGARFALAVASGGQALAIALRAAGVEPGEAVLANAFTLAPVPGAIAAVNARPVFVETTEALTVDLADLAAKAGQARVLLLSHMRGHIADMDALTALCDEHGLLLIEDCAHTMGARWRRVPSGRHGHVGCYSTQTYKHINSGEGGLIVTDDARIMARATLLSGSYMFFDRHPAGPEEGVFADLHEEIPNMSARMDALRAAILRPQLADLDAACVAWTERYRIVEQALASVPDVALIPRPAEEDFVGSSFQFRLPSWPPDTIATFIDACAERGVVLKWFGSQAPHGYTSRYAHWRFAAPGPLPRTDRILASLVDMRLPLAFTLEDCATIGTILAEEILAHAPVLAAAKT